jgi:apolipoprotein D and lipocalin family protein
MKSTRWSFALLFTVSMLAAACHEEPLDVAPDVNLGRFSGKWYEIAKLPRATQSDCTATTAHYTMVSGDALTMVNECHIGDPSGPLRSVSSNAKVPNRDVPAKLSVDFGGIYGDYWIIDVGPHYEYAVVGHPTRQYLWILSRTPTLDSETLSGVLERAKAKHFEVERLDYTKHL